MKLIQRGIRQNRKQFILLVVLTALVGSMVGMERSLLPQMAEKIFYIPSKTALFAFITVFGVTKAFTNFFNGQLANRFGRKKLLIAGWLFALPIPWILMYAPTWNWIIAANILLGVNQGLVWSSTIVMKLDFTEEKKRGFAMGVNEFAGYFAIGVTTFIVAALAAKYGVRPIPFFTGAVFSFAGLILSILWVKDTRTHMQAADEEVEKQYNSTTEKVTIFDRLIPIFQAGLVNNMNDGMMWGLYPLLLKSKGFSIAEVGLLTAIYPACWGIGQLFTGRLGDWISKKRLLYFGMLLQGLTLLLLAFAGTLNIFIVLSVVLGLGKALVYPNFSAAIAEISPAIQRAKNIGNFRFWRDLGYAVGAVLTGFLLDRFQISIVVVLIGFITLLSAFFIRLRMYRLQPATMVLQPL
jgi:MFS family permease